MWTLIPHLWCELWSHNYDVNFDLMITMLATCAWQLDAIERIRSGRSLRRSRPIIIMRAQQFQRGLNEIHMYISSQISHNQSSLLNKFFRLDLEMSDEPVLRWLSAVNWCLHQSQAITGSKPVRNSKWTRPTQAQSRTVEQMPCSVHPLRVQHLPWSIQDCALANFWMVRARKNRKWMKREENKVKNVDNLYHQKPISAGRIMSQAYLHLLKHSNHDFPPLSLHCIVMPGEIDL